MKSSPCAVRRVRTSLFDTALGFDHGLFILIGMAIAPWNVLAGGHIRSDEEERKREESGEGGRSIGGSQWKRTEDERKLCAALEQVGNEVGGASVSAGTFDFSSNLPGN